jgi:hypothetical protein
MLVVHVPYAADHANVMRVTVANHASLNPGAGAFGIMGWAWRAGQGANEVIASKIAGWGPPAGWLLMEWTVDNLLFKLHDGAAADTLITPAGVLPKVGWYHFAATRDSGPAGLKIYIRAGTPMTTASNDRDVSNATDMQIGYMIAAGAYHGRTSDIVYVVGAAPTPAEIQDHYFETSVPTSATNHWKLDEGAGTVATDSIGGRDGVLSVASWTAQTRCKARRAAA